MNHMEQNMNIRRRAVTLVEVLVAIAILMLIATIVWLALGPVAKEKSVEARIRSDLKQIVTAVNIYMADNDDKLPLREDALPKGTPKKIEGLDKHGSIGSPYGGNGYFYTQPYRMQVFSERFARYPWDSKSDPIVKAYMRFRVTGQKERYLDFDHKGGTQWKVREQTLLLGGRLDGSIAWFPVTQEFEREFAAMSWKLGRIR